MIRLLFIDDDESAQKALRMVLADEHEVLSSLTGTAGLAAIQTDEPDVILLDINLPDLDGMEVLKRISRMIDAPPVIMLTAYSDIQLVKQAIQFGAYDYILKPYTLEPLRGAIRRAVQNIPVRRSFRAGAEDSVLAPLIGESRVMREVKALLLRYAPSDCPVLIEGESGTGKELAARAIHALSPRHGGSMVAVNCGALPETLLESELFGSERGAYTDAVSRPGCFEQANGGTFFMDEIGEMSLSAQVKLLRVLEMNEVTRIGGRERIPLNVRIVSATNRDLKESIRDHKFREDLFYRISVLPVRIPPLRERKEDIPQLAAFFLREGSPEGAEPENVKSFDVEAMETLREHPWPGNIRELRNVVKRACLLSEGRIVRRRNIIL